MAVTIRCPNPQCGRSGSVADEMVSRSVRCPHCRTKFKVAEATGTPAAADQTRLSGSARATVGPPPGAGPTRSPAPAPPPGASVPARVGRFEVRALLGAGAFGTVYRAYDPQLDREV